MTNSTIAIALATLYWKLLKAVLYISSTTTSVARFGPPWVITKIGAKTWRLPITLMTEIKTKAGKIDGTVMCQNVWSGPAPSMWAAS